MALRLEDPAGQHPPADALQQIANNRKLERLLAGMSGAPATNDVLIWDGSSWVPGSVVLAKIAQGGAATDDLLAWSGSTWAPVNVRTTRPPVVTSLPGSPTDRDEVYYQADAAAGIYWHLRFRNAGASGKKWEFVGGPALYAEVETSESTVSTHTTYQDMTTVGPSLTLPLNGDYLYAWGCTGRCAATGGTANMALKIGAAAAADTEAVRAPENASGILASVSRERVYTAQTASDVIKAQYRTVSANVASTLERRWLAIIPIRVG